MSILVSHIIGDDSRRCLVKSLWLMFWSTVNISCRNNSMDWSSKQFSESNKVYPYYRPIYGYTKPERRVINTVRAILRSI
jgi:hypothetical protein